MKLKIYLASSWRNEKEVLSIQRGLKKEGFEVDAFCDQEHGRMGFNIGNILGNEVYNIDPISALEYTKVKEYFKTAFLEDKKWLDWANCVILLMPAGKSSHLEGGYAKGQGKYLFIYWMYSPQKGEFDNMYQFADGLYRPEELTELYQRLHSINNEINGN